MHPSVMFLVKFEFTRRLPELLLFFTLMLSVAMTVLNIWCVKNFPLKTKKINYICNKNCLSIRMQMFFSLAGLSCKECFSLSIVLLRVKHNVEISLTFYVMPPYTWNPIFCVLCFCSFLLFKPFLFNHGKI